MNWIRYENSHAQVKFVNAVDVFMSFVGWDGFLKCVVNANDFVCNMKKWFILFKICYRFVVLNIILVASCIVDYKYLNQRKILDKIIYKILMGFYLVWTNLFFFFNRYCWLGYPIGLITIIFLWWVVHFDFLLTSMDVKT